jgi:hypothetical protein
MGYFIYLFVCLLICCIFNDAVSDSDYVVSNDWMIMKNELEIFKPFTF